MLRDRLGTAAVLIFRGTGCNTAGIVLESPSISMAGP